MYLWKKYDYMPESIHMINEEIIDGRYIHRPESIESLYHLYKLTHDKEILQLSYEILEKIRQLEVKCGFAYVKNITAKTLTDEMPSFFLSETLKYLYLIFDEDNQFSSSDYLLTTEAHIFNINIAQTQEIRKYINSQSIIVNETDEKCVYNYKPISYICPLPSIYETSSIIKSVEEYLQQDIEIEKEKEETKNIDSFIKSSIYIDSLGIMEIEYSSETIIIKHKFSYETIKLDNIYSSTSILVNYKYYEYDIEENYFYNPNNGNNYQCSLSSPYFKTDLSCFLHNDLNDIDINKNIMLFGLSIIENHNFSCGCDDYTIVRKDNDNNYGDDVYIYVEDGDCITDVKIRHAIVLFTIIYLFI